MFTKKNTKLHSKIPKVGWSIENKLVIGYRELLQKGRSNYYRKEGDIGYIISMSWLENWK